MPEVAEASSNRYQLRYAASEKRHVPRVASFCVHARHRDKIAIVSSGMIPSSTLRSEAMG